MARIKRNMDIIIILVVGFALRFTISITHSYSNDELSAINRLDYNNFSDLVQYGVKAGDMHPAGVQIFMKVWSQIGGTGELWMRLPFVVLGTLSILIIFLIGKRWINRQAGLLAAIFLSLLFFPVLNSEFARPYSPGLFLSLLAAWFYLKLLFDEKKKYKDAIFLGLTLSAAMYTHHFAFLFVGWLGLSGLVYSKKSSLKHILISAVVAVVLYLPHVPITRYQTSIGGLEWLGSPDNDWLFQFVFHAFNESWWVVGGIFILLALSFIIKEKTELKNLKMLLLSLIWFFGIYIIGHIYSISQTPVLKFPVMLFALPYLLLPLSFLLSRFRFQTIQYSILMILLAVSTTREKDLFGNMHYGLFKEIAEDMVRWNEDYGDENIYTVFNINNPNYINFYANQWGQEISIDWDVIEYHHADSVRQELKDKTQQYCVVGYSAKLTKPDIFETCKEFFPNLLEYKKYNNSAVFLLAKGRPAQLTQQKALLTYMDEYRTNGWEVGEEQLRTDSILIFNFKDTSNNPFYYNHLNSYVMDQNYPYKPFYEFSLDKIENPYDKYVKINLRGFSHPKGKLTIYVNAVRNNKPVEYKGEIFWLGRDVEQHLLEDKKAHFVFKVPEFLEEDDVIKIGLWNRDPENPIHITYLDIVVYDNIWN